MAIALLLYLLVITIVFSPRSPIEKILLQILPIAFSILLLHHLAYQYIWLSSFLSAL